MIKIGNTDHKGNSSSKDEAFVGKKSIIETLKKKATILKD